MAGECNKISIQCLHIHFHVGGTLGGIDQHNTAVAVYQLDHFLYRVYAAQHVGNMANGGQLYLGADDGFQLFIRQAAVFFAFQVNQLGTGLAGNHLPRQHVAVVLHDGDDDLIPGMDVVQRIAVSNQIDAFGGVAGKDNFGIAAGVQELAYPLAGGLVTVSRLHAQFIQAAQGVGVGLLIKFFLCLQNAGRALRGGGAVQIGDVLLHQQGKVLFIIHKIKAHRCAPP